MVSLLVILLSGCGFHLKGYKGQALDQNQGLPKGVEYIKTIYPVYENVSASFRQEFQQILIENNQLADEIEFAGFKINFSEEKCQRQSLSVSDMGITVEYRLSCTVRYNYRTQGSNLEKYQEITENRDFQSNNSQLLAADSRQSLLKQQIQQRISRLIIHRLR